MIVLIPTRLEMRRLFPELGPAPTDRRAIAWLPATRSRPPVDVAWCGFGLASAGAGAASILAARADDACLVGLSGTLAPDLAPVGSAVLASRVECHGLGLPTTASGSELDSELATDPSMASPAPPTIPAELRSALAPGDRVGAMLSVAVPSVTLAEAEQRAVAHPGCVVEEMESLAVLHAAMALGRSLSVIRGVSNIAGERDKGAWNIDAAVGALRAVLDRWLAAGSPR